MTTATLKQISTAQVLSESCLPYIFIGDIGFPKIYEEGGPHATRNQGSIFFYPVNIFLHDFQIFFRLKKRGCRSKGPIGVTLTKEVPKPVINRIPFAFTTAAAIQL